MGKEKVGHISDLHINMNFNLTSRIIDNLVDGIVKYLEEEGYTILIINGDISYEVEYTKEFLDKLETKYKGKVYITLGNHDIHKEMSVYDYLYKKPRYITNYLPQEPIELEDKIIYGLNGFSDFTFKRYVKDEEEALKCKEKAYNRVKADYFDISIEEYLNIVPTQINLLDKVIENTNKEGKKIVLCTHFVPNEDYVLDSSGNEGLSIKNILMGSNITRDYIRGKGIDEVYFGHTHRRLTPKEGDYLKDSVSKVRYYCNPIGTHREWLKWGYIEPTAEESTVELWLTMLKRTIMEIK